MLPFRFPRHPRFRFVAALVLVLAAGGCGDEPAVVPDGLFWGGEVPPGIRRDLNAATDSLLVRLQEGRLETIYDEASASMKTMQPRNQFLQSMAQLARAPLSGNLRTTHAVLLGFGPEFPYQEELEVDTGAEDPVVVYAGSEADQAMLVQESDSGPEVFRLVTVWVHEEGVWKLHLMGGRNSTYYGRDWESYSESAAAHRRQGNLRNAAILYNVALELVAPAPWIRPAELPVLQRRQRRLTVSHLPVPGRPDVWALAPGDSIIVRGLDYHLAPDSLALRLTYDARHAIQDTAALNEDARGIHRHVMTAFPEYGAAFGALVVEAQDPADRRRGWRQAFRLGPAP